MHDDSPYQGYVYAYPHKTAYRPLTPPVALAPLWQAENRHALFLYVHIPFCEMRCGFCNLLTRANPEQTLLEAYLQTLHRQITVTRAQIGDCHIAGLALGGGTPTYLSAEALQTLFAQLTETWQLAWLNLPSSVETSPATATTERLAVLQNYGIERISMGVQSFLEAEVAKVGRYQNNIQVQQAITAIRAAGFPILNLDLIYGIEGQTANSWDYSLQAALDAGAEEIYLYPLYVRPLTGLGKKLNTRQAWDDWRLALYRQGRDTLRAAGYQQCSMRLFRAPWTQTLRSTPYRCQEDGMVGLGCGARSYTKSLHYSHAYAVSAKSIQDIIRTYIALSDTALSQACYGVYLNTDEQRRRYLLKSLLQSEGLDSERYQQCYGTQPEEDFPILHTWTQQAWVVSDLNGWRLTDTGMERADALGPALFSPSMRTAMATFALQ